MERPVQLKFGETADIGSQGLSIEFVEVLEDSRCASDVTCIWEGRAKVLLAVAVNGEDLGRHELVLEGGQSELATASVGGYMIVVLTLDPYPVTTQEGEPDYVVTLAVSEDSGREDQSPVRGKLHLRLRRYIRGQLLIRPTGPGNRDAPGRVAAPAEKCTVK